MGERSTILFINLLKIVSLLCERLVLKLYSAKERSMLNSDTQEYIPQIISFTDANGNDTTKEQVEANYRQIKLDVIEIIEREKERIANDPELRHLVEKKGE